MSYVCKLLPNIHAPMDELWQQLLPDLLTLCAFILRYTLRLVASHHSTSTSCMPCVEVEVDSRPLPPPALLPLPGV